MADSALSSSAPSKIVTRAASDCRRESDPLPNDEAAASSDQAGDVTTR
jgi:hypothetical protein